MNRLLNPDRYAEDLPPEPGDDEFDEWTLDDLERSADLGSVRSAWAQSSVWSEAFHG